MHTMFNSYKGSRASKPQITPLSIKDWRGGLRVVGSDQTLQSNYQVVAKNIYTNKDGKPVARFGFEEKANLPTNPVEITYYQNFILAFLDDGTIYKIDSSFTQTAIWNTTIAAALPGAPTAWSATNHVDFTEFDGELVVCNGVDKPILISTSLSVTYLQDLATGSNINTPIGKHVTTVDNYVVFANTSDDKTIHIASKGTSGTYVGDPAPNDGISLNLGKYVGSGNTEIVGVSNFNNKLIVFFDLVFLVVQLGIYDGSVHVPDVVDVVQRAGMISHQSSYVADTDIVFMSRSGVYTARQATFSEQFEITPRSDNVSRDLLANLAELKDEGEGSFMVVDELEQVMFFFVKDTSNVRHGYMMRYSADLKKISWSEVAGWDFSCGCSTLEKRVFFCEGTKLYQYGNDIFADENYYDDDGTNIEVDFELPWLDMGSRAQKKRIGRILADTEGTAEVTIQIFRDKIYKDSLGNYDPAVEMDIKCGSSGGYGNPSTGYGGGRRADDERHWGLPLECNLMKFRVFGSINAKMLWTSVTFFVAKGNLQI